MKKIDFLMAGVGGQGTILASNILAEAGVELGYDVKTAEVHGVAQRGGSVESHVRWEGERVYSPLVEQGKADYVIGFEMLEAGRWPMYLHKDSVVLINRYRIPPPAVNLGKATYPPDQEIEAILSCKGSEILWIDATEIARGLGNPAMVGVVLLGALSGLVGGAEDLWLSVIERLVPDKFVEMNKKAFLAGRSVQLN
ncbi:MAG: indolepyruvate oxidoreductase subunit beta [Bacillota bacterium]|nr:indolepyruvate oxidoreductase subunit beta [Bacillota bacterium]